MGGIVGPGESVAATGGKEGVGGIVGPGESVAATGGKEGVGGMVGPGESDDAAGGKEGVGGMVGPGDRDDVGVRENEGRVDKEGPSLGNPVAGTFLVGTRVELVGHIVGWGVGKDIVGDCDCVGNSVLPSVVGSNEMDGHDVGFGVGKECVGVAVGPDGIAVIVGDDEVLGASVCAKDNNGRNHHRDTSLNTLIVVWVILFFCSRVSSSQSLSFYAIRSLVARCPL